MHVVGEGEERGAGDHGGRCQQQRSRQAVIATELRPGFGLLSFGQRAIQHHASHQPQDHWQDDAEGGRAHQAVAVRHQPPQQQACHGERGQHRIPRPAERVGPQPRRIQSERNRHADGPQRHEHALQQQAHRRPLQHQRARVLLVVQGDDRPAGNDGGPNVRAITPSPVGRVQRAGAMRADDRLQPLVLVGLDQQVLVDVALVVRVELHIARRVDHRKLEPRRHHWLDQRRHRNGDGRDWQALDLRLHRQRHLRLAGDPGPG